MLYEKFDSDEEIKALIGGRFRADTSRLSGHFGIAGNSNKRVMFLDKGILGSTEVMEISYRNIEAITYSTGTLMGGIQVTGRGVASFRLEDIPDKDALQPFADCVRGYITGATNGPAPVTSPTAMTTPAVDQTAISPLDEIERLAELTAKGILTEEEFAAKKKQLLGI